MRGKKQIAERVKRLRLSRGWTLDELAAHMGGIVTKQAISKYERGLDYPSAPVLAKLASAFQLKTIQLISEPKYKINFIAYRKCSGLSKREQSKIENFVLEKFEERLKIQNIICPNAQLNVPVNRFSVNTFEDVERAADCLRSEWDLGKDEMQNITLVLENKLIHILEIEANEKFDGIAAIAYDHSIVKGAVIVVRKGTSGERQRLNIAHELGHLVLKMSSLVDDEKAAFRFGAAFIAPKELMSREVGSRRVALTIQELLILKKKIGLSIQAILYRLKDLKIISEQYCTVWFKYISIHGWKREEPGVLPVEKTEWLKQNIYKAFAESLINQQEAEMILDEKIDDSISLSLKKLRSFMKLPLEERRRILSEQATRVASTYEKGEDDSLWQGGDFIEQ